MVKEKYQMDNIVIIHLLWTEYEWDEDKIYSDFNSKSDYGIYQIYGDHPVYGENALLYIGKAKEQTYSVRLNQHDFLSDSHISKFSKLCLSSFCKTEDVNSKKKWRNYIDLAEKLLINAHFPAYNQHDVHGVLKTEDFKDELLILNWNERGKLLPEVSSLRYSYYYWNGKIDGGHIFKR
jgi:hypothetical protein